MLKNYEKAEVVVALKDIAAGTYITEDNRKEYFGVIELPKDAVMENVIVNIKDIEEYQVSYDMQKNEQLTKNKMLDTTTEILGAYENPVEASLKVENISSAVAGTLRRGDRVDIVGHAGTDENQNEQFVTGDTLETILEDVYISGAYNSNGEEITVDSAINASVVFNFIIEKDDYTEQNREMLKKAPHREFEDLSVIYRLVVKADENGIQSSIIKNEMVNMLGIKEEEMYSLAMKNTERIFPHKISRLDEIIRDMMLKDGLPEEVVAELLDIKPEVGNAYDKETQPPTSGQDMWVISNERGINGATAMLYEEKLNELAEKLADDLYILPSSIHEVIAIGASNCNPDNLSYIVYQVNMGEVQPEERLSNNIYHYDRSARVLSMVNNDRSRELEMISRERPERKL